MVYWRVRFFLAVLSIFDDNVLKTSTKFAASILIVGLNYTIENCLTLGYCWQFCYYPGSLLHKEQTRDACALNTTSAGQSFRLFQEKSSPVLLLQPTANPFNAFRNLLSLCPVCFLHPLRIF